MNKIWSFLLGLGVGSAVTYFFVKKEYETVAERKINEVIRYYENVESDEDDIQEDASTDSQTSEDDLPEEQNEQVQTNDETTQAVDYSSKSKKENNTESKEVSNQSQVNTNLPYRISLKDVLSGKIDDDGEDFEYFEISITTDGVVVDDDDFIIDDSLIEEFIGRDNYNNFLKNSLEHEMYIYNPIKGMAFAVGKISESYDEYAKHIPERKRFQSS